MTTETLTNGSCSDQHGPEVRRWLAWLEASGWPTRSVAIQLGFAPHTVQGWKAGRGNPSDQALTALRLLALAVKVCPTLAKRLILSEDEFAAELDGLRIRALVHWEVDRTVRRAL